MNTTIELKAQYLSQETGLHPAHCKSLLNTRDDLDLLSAILKLDGQSAGRKRKLFHLKKRLKKMEPFFDRTNPTAERNHANAI